MRGLIRLEPLYVGLRSLRTKATLFVLLSLSRQFRTGGYVESLVRECLYGITLHRPFSRTGAVVVVLIKRSNHRNAYTTAH